MPEYGRPLMGSFGHGILTGTEQALRRFLAEDADEEDGASGIYRALGRGEHRAGRSLDALQAAYRIGARVAWRRVSRLAAAAQVTMEAQQDLAEAIFAYIDQLAAESVEGYAEAQAAEAGSRQHRREELLRLMLGEPAAPLPAIQAAANRAAWRLPQRMAMIAVEPEAAARVARRLSGDVLYGSDDRHGYVAAPDAARAGREAAAAAARYGVAVGLGPEVELGDVGRSWRWAALALRGASPGRVAEAQTQLAELVLAASPELVAALRDQVLAPLREETETSRARLEATLLAWLRCQGSQAAVAAELGVHPQTVRYRMGRLRGLLGPQLDDPDGRFALELALRGRPGRSSALACA